MKKYTVSIRWITGCVLHITLVLWFAACSLGGDLETLRAKITKNASSEQFDKRYNIQATAESMSSIKISWNTVDGAISYNIYRSGDGVNNFTKLNSSAVTGTVYNDTYLTPSTTYYYQVRTIDTNGIEGSKSTVAFATTDGLPAPANVNARALSASSIAVTWDSVSGAGSYNIYRAESKDGNYVIANIAVLTEISYTDTGLSASTAYYYKICAVEGGIEGTRSNPVSALTAVAGSTAVEGNSLAQKLAWLQNNAVSDRAYTIDIFADEIIAPAALAYSSRNRIGITIRGIGAMRTINLSANGSVFTVASGITLVLDNNLTLQGRNSNSASLVMINSGGSLELRGNSKITGNTLTANAFTYGGGVYVQSDAHFTMSGTSAVSGNTATATGYYLLSSGVAVYYTGRGGGVFMNTNGVFIMQDNSVVSGNNATGYGGGIYNDGGTFTIRNSVLVSRNTANSGGGGIRNDGGTFTMENSAEVSHNTASTGHGGGVFNETRGSLVMWNNTKISDNTAGSYGGGVYCENASDSFSMRDNATVSGNRSQRGGGIYNDGIFIMRENAAVLNNTAALTGGGVYNSSAVFQIGGGTIYGSNAAAGLDNSGPNAALHKASASGQAKYGSFNGDTFIPAGDLTTTDNTIQVVNGVLQ